LNLLMWGGVNIFPGVSSSLIEITYGEGSINQRNVLFTKVI